MNNLDLQDVGHAKNGFRLLAFNRIRESERVEIHPEWFEEKIHNIGIYNYAFLITWMDHNGILFSILKQILKINGVLYLIIPDPAIHLLFENVLPHFQTINLYTSVDDFEQRRK